MKTYFRKFSGIFYTLILSLGFGLGNSNAQTAETLNFDGTDDYVQMSSLSFGSNWTAEAWINPTNLFGNWNVVLSQCSYTFNQGFVIAVQSGSVFVDIPNVGNIAAPVTGGVWTHVAVTYNNGIYAFYKNGILVGVKTGTFSNSTNPFYVGIRTDNNNVGLRDPYQGNIDEVRIWNTTRTQCQIQQYMNCEIPTSATGLVANYHFSDGIANGLNFVVVLGIPIIDNSTLTDASGNGHTGQLNNYGLSLGGSSSNWTSPGSPAQGLTTPASASTASIAVTGNGNSITDGSTSPLITNYTDFGANITSTFVITNTGSQTLNVGTPVFTGPNASEFSVTVLPSSVLAATSGSTSFVVAFAPTSVGTKSATINIYDSECSKNVYDFVITATAVAAAALNFDGIKDNVHMADPVFGLSDFTIEGWIKPATTSTAGGFIAASRYNEGFQTGYWWTLHCGGDAGSGRSISLELAECGNGVSNYQSLNSTHSVTSGAWSHVAVVRSGSTYYLYVNGILSSQMTEYASHNLNNGFNNINIGGWPQNNSSWFRGEMDELRFWKVARTQCEIQTYMDCEVAATPTTLVGNYHFNQGVASGNNTVTLLADASTSARTGTLGVTTFTFNLKYGTSNWIAPGAIVSNYTTFTSPNVEIDVRGNGNSIIDGNTGTSPVDFTDFNGALTRTYTIHNTNPGLLAIGVPYLSGADANQFSITTLPSTSLSGVSSTTIVVAFSPTSTGVKSATLNIPSSDCDEPVYDFKITATPPAAAALNFDGSTDEVSLPAMNFTSSSVTIEGWFYANGTQLANAGLVFHRGCSTCGLSSGINIAPSDNTKLSYTWADYYGWVGPAYPLNTWFHVALVVDATKAVMYLNGVPYVNSVPHSTQAFAGTTYIGKDAETCCGNRHFNGSVDELRFWNTGRTGCDIQTYMNCEIPTTATDLVANYHFNQGSAGISNSTVTTLTDAAGSHAGTLSSFNLTGTSSNWIAPGGVVSGSVTSAAPTASILVSGNSNSITPGSTTTSTLDFTDFGSSSTRTFVIQNSNTGTLNPSIPYFTGTNASDFSVTVLPSTSILGSATTSFVVAFTPTSGGVKNATLNIVENSCLTPLFSCAITATPPVAEALNFNGGNQYVELGSNITELGLGDFTIETWIKTTGNDMGILTCSDGDANWEPGEKCFLIENDGHLEFVGHGCDYIHASQTYSVNDGLWHHVALTWDLQSSPNGVGKIYVDGIDRTASSTYTALTSNLGTFKIGLQNYGESNLNFSGNMDEFRIWNVARSQCEIQSYMQCEITGTMTNLIANYHFNQGTPFLNNISINTLTDGAASPFTGTLTNFVLTGTVSNWVSPGGVITGSTTPSPPTASILVSGNSNSITPGSTSTSTLNFTDFGTANTRTFVIQNSNLGALDIATPYFTGTNSADFSITIVPSTSLAASATTSFEVTFSPTSTGVKNATLNINNNTCSIPIFSCAITATPATATGLDFSGGSNYITASGHTLNGQSFSIEFWAKRYNNTTSDFIFGQGTSTTNNGLHIGFYDQGVGDYFIFDFWNSGLSVNHSDYNWHHWACVYDASRPAGEKNRFIYRDGILVAMDSYTSSYAGSGTSYIGSTPWTPIGDIFTGSLDEMRIWGTARSQCEIETYMNCEIPASAPGLISNYHFNQGSPGVNNTAVTTLIDAAATPHTGTLTGFALTNTVSNWISPSAIGLNYTTAVAPTGSFIITGNGNNIPVGVTTTTTNLTDFGTNTTHTFVVSNPGAGPLYVNTGYITGANASNFIVTAAPGSVIAGGSSANLVIAFSPTAIGTYSAILNVVSSDCTYPTYSFVVTATAKPATALDFDGSDDYVSVPHNSAFNLTNAMCLEAWIKLVDNSNVFYIMSKGTDDGAAGQYGLVVTYNTVQFHMYEVSPAVSVQSTQTITPGVWTHVAGSWDGSVMSVYVNGILDAVQPYTGTMTTNTDPFLIGRLGVVPYQFKGSIDEVRVWSTPRTQCEIQQYMNCEIPTTATGLVANYHFNQGAVNGANTLQTVLTDAANTHTGTLNLFNLTGSTSNWVAPGGVISGSTIPASITASIIVSGNSNSITPGSTTTSTLDFTDFGTSTTRTFVVQNSNTGTLNILSPFFTGVNASEFSVSVVPSLSLGASATTSFVVAFTPTAGGFRTATLNILDNVCGLPIFSCAIGGTPAPASALAFDGTGDYVEIPNSSANNFTLTNAFTVEFWAKINSDVGGGTFVNKGSGMGQEQYSFDFAHPDFRFYILNTNTVFPTIQVPRTSVITVADGWVHIAGTYDGNKLTLYRNGIVVASMTVPAVPLMSNNNPLCFGAQAQPSLNAYFDGQLDEVRLWNVARTQCEIQTYMNCEITGTMTGLTSNYHCNQGAAGLSNPTQSVIIDALAVGNGTLNNFSLAGNTSNWVAPGPFANDYTISIAPSTSITPTGNALIIPMGVTTSTSNYTDFGPNTTRTFGILNPSGANPLYINNITFSGANAANFSVTTLPSSSINVGGSTFFVVTFTPSAIGSQSALLNINSSDCSNPNYSFVITASTSPAEALDFSGFAEYVAIPVMDFSGPNKLTFEAWVKPTDITSGAGYFEIMRQDASISVTNWLVAFQNAGTILSFGLNTSSGYNELDVPITSTYFTDGNWHHVAAVFDGATKRLYVDGIQVGMAAETGTIVTGSVVHSLGRANFYGEFFIGGMDEVRYWNVARTQCQIQSYMHCEMSGSPAGLIANYHFNQGIPSGSNTSVTTLTDALGINNGTLTSFVLTGSVSNWVSPGAVISGSITPAVLSQTLNVKGNGNNIPVGVTTSTNNFTDFSSNNTRVFVVENIGSGPLYVNSVYFTGADAYQFSVTAAPASSISGSGSSSFTILFTPTVVGTASAIVNIVSSDCVNPTYSFVVTASTSPASALSFDGSNDDIILPLNSAFDFTTGTVEAWININSAGSNGCIASMRNSSTTRWSIHANVSLQNITVYNGSSIAAFSVALSTGTWYHVAVVMTPTNMTAYVNGVYAGTSNVGINTGDTGHNLNIGTTNDVSSTFEHFNGRMDELRVWGGARTQCEIQQYMNCEIPTTTTNLLANFHFNQGIPSGTNPSITTLTDATGVNSASLNTFSLTGSASNWVSPGGVISGSTTPATISQTLNIKGNGNNVPIGVTTSTNNFTDFSTNATRVFVAENIGSGTLYLNGISFAGANASEFSVSSNPTSSIAGAGSSSFTIVFTPTAIGTSSAIVNINSSDCSNPNYSFVITASASPASALDFDGGNDLITVSSGINLNNQSFTVEFWSKRNGTTNDIIVGQGTTVSTNQALQIGFRGGASSNVFTFAFYSNDINYTTTAASDGNYHHWACVYDNTVTSGTNRFLYLDGELVYSDRSNSAFLGTGSLLIGDAGYGANPYSGQLDELRIWNTPRTQCEIQTYMNCEITGSVTGLAGNFHFNQGIPSGSNTSITSLINDVGSANGSLSGFSLIGGSSNFVSPAHLANGYTVTSTPNLTVSITGNGNPVFNNSTSTSTLNYTDFGTSSTRTFVINNSGPGILSSVNLMFTGLNASEFSITVPPSATIAASGSSSFVVLFTPTAVSVSQATLNLNTNDCFNNIFNFALTATTAPASALSFDGGSGYVDLGSGTNLKPTTALTAEAWINAGNWPTVDQTFIGNTENNGWGILSTNVSGNLEGYVRRNGAWATVGTPLSGIAPGWHHVALTYDGRYTKLYLDGVMKNINDAGATYTVDYNPFNSTLIGAEASGGSTPVSGWAFTGSIDEVRIWNTARTQCEILSYMNCEIPTTTTNLVANYHFNEGIPSGSNAAVTTLTDAAGSNTGTLVSVTLTGSLSNWVNPGGVNSGSFTPAVLSQTISLLGNGNPIPIGSTTGTLNFTDFGSSTTRIYTIHNSGMGVLYIDPTITISGAAASDFSLTALPASSISGVGSTTFAVSFIPSSLGTKTAIVTVGSSDCSAPVYSFVISASPSSGAALNFDGVDDRAKIPVFNTAINDITYEAKVYWAGPTATNQAIVYNGNTYNSGYGIYIQSSGNQVNLLYGGIMFPSLNYTLVPNQWTTLSLVIETGKISFYANGILTTTINPGSSVPGTPAGYFCVGSNNTDQENFNGTIDEVRLFTRALSQCEISAYLNCEINSTLTGLEANYHFNQGIASGINPTVTTVTDASGNGHDLTISGMSLFGQGSNWVTPGAVTSGSSCSTYSAPEIAVVGGTASLNSGDSLPSSAKDTDYGNISSSGITVHTFTIQNNGNTSLSVSSITMSGADAGSYLVGSLIPSSPIAAGNFAVFNVTFAPSSSGTKTAMVNISNTDCDEALFTYMLTGSGANGQSFIFDGADDYVNCGNILTASYTKEAWINIGTSSNGNNFVSTGTGVVGSAFWAPGIYSYKLSAGHDGLWNQVQDATALSANTWYHVAVTYDAPSTTMSLYKNGILVATSNTVQPYTGSSPLQLGAYAGTYVVNGSMDEVRIWNRALCASEIVNNMNCEIQTTAPGLVGNYHFNQGIGYGANNSQTIVTDFSGAGNTGTVVNAALSGTTSNWQFTTAVTSGSFCPVITVPEINLVGNGVSIADGKTVSATLDHTDFGSVCINTVMVRTYTVQNTGAGPLSITNMSMSGTNSSLFTISSLSPSSPISAGNSAVFSVTFAPTSSGTKSATIVIGNDDCTESVYDFVLTGTCNVLPVVTATASGSVICNGATVTLNGGGADTYTWTGGSPTVTDNVAFTPSTTLNYTVFGTNILTGCTSTNVAVQGITVNPSPTISATVSNSVICAGATTTVFPANAGSYTLVPGPLSGTSIAVSPTITTSYTLTGTSLSGCNSFNNIPITITVNALPTVTANTTSSVVCDGFTTSVYGSGADTYTWTGGVTNSVSFVPAASQVYTVSGTYTLTGCVSTNIATQSVVVNALPSVTASAINSVICDGNQATLTASGASNYTWLPGPVYGATVTVNPPSLTIYTVSGTSTANCTSTNLAIQSVSVNALPTVTANISNSLACEGSSITLNGSGADTYVWTGGMTDGQSFTVSTNSTYSVTGTNTLTGCTSTNNAAVTLSVNSLPAISVNISSPEICIGNTVTLSASGGTSYVWSGMVTDNVAFTPTATADYTVTGTDINSCVNSSVVTVTVNTLPILSVMPTNSLNCEAQSNTLTVAGASTYTWSGGETTDSIVITPTANTSYTILGIDTNGCAGQLIYTQSVTPCSDTILVSTLLVDESCKGKGNGSIALSFTTAQQNYQTAYYWSEPALCPNNDCDSLGNLKAGNYSVKIKITYTLNSTLVRSDSTTSNFEIKEGGADCVLKVYSGITRNGDGVNDFMYIENIEQYPNNTVSIFTRWGEQIYTMKGYNNIDRLWPVEGELSTLSSNTYFYVLDPGDGGKVIKGWIELIKK